MPKGMSPTSRAFSRIEAGDKKSKPRKSRNVIDHRSETQG